jgi:hypothetical protein
MIFKQSNSHLIKYAMLMLIVAVASGSICCGSGGSGNSAAMTFSGTLSVSPTAVTLGLGAMQQFVTSTAVNWSIGGPACDSSRCGYMSADNVYYAPQVLTEMSSVVLTASSVANSSATATVTVTLVPGFSISISGPSIVDTNGHITYIAAIQVNPGANPLPDINWSISGANCNNDGCGTIDPAGQYVAPTQLSGPLTLTITADAQADQALSASMSVSIVPLVVQFPGAVVLAPGSTQQFVAQVRGYPDQSVTWGLLAPGCQAGGSQCGIVSSDGTYTAPIHPPSPTYVIVVATSVAFSDSSGSSTVVVNSPMSKPPALLDLMSYRLGDARWSPRSKSSLIWLSQSSNGKTSVAESSLFVGPLWHTDS